jgi:hypothetical protein
VGERGGGGVHEGDFSTSRGCNKNLCGTVCLIERSRHFEGALGEKQVKPSFIFTASADIMIATNSDSRC